MIPKINFEGGIPQH